MINFIFFTCNTGLKWHFRWVGLNWYFIQHYIQKQQTVYLSFSSAHRTFSRTDHILGHKASHGKFKKTEIISSIFSDYKAMRLEINAMRLKINKKKKTLRNTNMWQLNNMLLNSHWITEEIKEEIKK